MGRGEWRGELVEENGEVKNINKLCIDSPSLYREPVFLNVVVIRPDMYIVSQDQRMKSYTFRKTVNVD